MSLFASCSAGVLPAALLLLLFSSTALCDCPRPNLPLHSSLREGVLEDTYPAGTNLRLKCIPGYENIPGIQPRMTCLDTSKWSDLPTLCQGKRCPVPHIENGKIVSSNDLRLGEEVTLACEYGFRMIGGTTRRCVVRSGVVDWNTELPTCHRIPCARPPLIANGEYDPDSSDMYDVGWVTIYRCDRDYSLIGSSTITCIVAENGVDGTWDLPAPKCKRITCARPPVISNGIYDPNPSDVYDAGWVVIYRCDPDYSLIGNSTITCIVAENGVVGKWDLPSPECKKVKCRRPSIPNGNVASVFQATYTYQNNLQIECNPGYTLLGSSSIQCGADSQWKPSLPSCDKIPTTPKPTKSPPAVPSTPSIFPWPGIVSTKEDGTEKKSLEDRLDIIEKKLDLILHILQLTRDR